MGREDRAIEADQRGIVAIAGGVDGSGYQFLAGPALAGDQDGLGRWSDSQNLLTQRLHAFAGSDHRGRIRFAGLIPPGRFPAQQPAVAHRVIDEPLESIGVERFLDIVEGTMTHRLDGRRHRGVGCDHDGLGRVLALLELDDEFQTAHTRHL